MPEHTNERRKAALAMGMTAMLGLAGPASAATDLSPSRVAHDFPSRIGAPVAGQMNVTPDGGEAGTFRTAQSSVGAADVEDRVWFDAVRGGTLAGYGDYLDRYSSGRYAAEARSRILSRLNGTSQSQTPSATPSPTNRAAAAEAEIRLNAAGRQDIQNSLTALGYDTNGVDGVFGQGTRRAIGRWQADQGLDVTGYLDGGQVARIDAAAPASRQPPFGEAEADADYWSQVGNRGDAAGLRAYLARYPDGRYAQIARTRLDNSAAATPAPATPQDQLNNLLSDGIRDLLNKK